VHFVWVSWHDKQGNVQLVKEQIVPIRTAPGLHKKQVFDVQFAQFI
jgi:hypothetical protein